MQVTNILRDIDEDTAAGRIYVPASLIAQRRLSDRGAREKLTRELIGRADDLYEQGKRAIALLGNGGAAMSLAMSLYRQILREVERELGGIGRGELDGISGNRHAAAP